MNDERLDRELTEEEIKSLYDRVDKYVKDGDIKKLGYLCKALIIRSRV